MACPPALSIKKTFFCLFFLCFSLPSFSNSLSTPELKRQAAGNHIDAEYLLGYRYEIGKIVKRNNKKAIYWYKKAARKNHLDAQYRIGALYYKNKQYSKARYWLAKRAKGGHAAAQYYFANTFRYALGTKEQTSTARKWYLKAAKQGHAKAQYELGLLYQKGIGARKSQQLANKWFEKSAKQGDKRAKKQLPRPPRPKKNKQQQKQHEKAVNNAHLGDREQQYELGMRYLLGYQTGINKKQAIYWLKKAAAQNHALAQYQIANQYLRGDFLKKDIDRSIQLFTAAAEKNVQTAKTALKYLKQPDSTNTNPKF